MRVLAHRTMPTRTMPPKSRRADLMMGTSLFHPDAVVTCRLSTLSCPRARSRPSVFMVGRWSERMACACGVPSSEHALCTHARRCGPPSSTKPKRGHAHGRAWCVRCMCIQQRRNKRKKTRSRFYSVASETHVVSRLSYGQKCEMKIELSPSRWLSRFPHRRAEYAGCGRCMHPRAVSAASTSAADTPTSALGDRRG